MTTAKRPRGMGRIFQRGPRYWIGYSVDGQEHREPGGASEHEADLTVGTS